MPGLLSAWLAEVALISYRSVKAKSPGPLPIPMPSDYVASVVVFGTLGLVATTRAAPVAALVGWGLVVATLLNLWNPSTGGVNKPAAAKAAPATPATATKGAS